MSRSIGENAGSMSSAPLVVRRWKCVPVHTMVQMSAEPPDEGAREYATTPPDGAHVGLSSSCVGERVALNTCPPRESMIQMSPGHPPEQPVRPATHAMWGPPSGDTDGDLSWRPFPAVRSFAPLPLGLTTQMSD